MLQSSSDPIEFRSSHLLRPLLCTSPGDRNALEVSLKAEEKQYGDNLVSLAQRFKCFVSAHDLDYFRDDTALFTSLRDSLLKSNHRCDLMEE